ncbi:MAG: glycoside hydrolase family 130 protein [Methylacidiphilales bacterium]|nr:glycoside hydrolase family 130 protein [Candidatus Methylacidiphilales bacterium]
MKELVERFPENPILSPVDVRPSREDMVVECLLNPGAFRFKGRTGLLLRVAERPKQEEGWVSTPLLDPESEGGIRILRIRKDDPDFKAADPRVFEYKDRSYLTTLSHLRLAWSDDGVHFAVDERPTLPGMGSHESFGIEDCRVEFIEGTYWLTYTAVSEFGICVGMSSTKDWRNFTKHGVIFPPNNKDCALFPEKIKGFYHALHRPSGGGPGGNFIWVSRSPDMLHWGDHRCIAMTRPGEWDSARIGAGAAPIKTPKGWLEIYHGATAVHRYCLAALLLDLDDPSRVLARSREPFMQPVAEYEQKGFVGNVVFTNGHLVDGDQITIYYGASDTVICGARASVTAILDSL